MAFYTNSLIICIFLKISKVFDLLIRLQILILERSTISKFISKYKPLEVINRDNFVKTILLLLVINLAITNFFD